MKTKATDFSKTQAAMAAAVVLEEVVNSLRFYASDGFVSDDCHGDLPAFINQWSDPTCLSADSLAAIKDAVAGCEQCYLCHSPVNHVPGTGSASARLMFVGGWPAADVGSGGTHFTGETGRLLTAMITAMELVTADVYVTCLMKCRPLGEEAPQEGQMERCQGFLEREMALISPDLICALGESAARWLLGSRVSLESLRGHFHKRGAIMVMPTWHPADILTQAERKRPLWEDLKKVMAALKNVPHQ